MKKLAIAATMVGALGLAAPALAGPGQCYDHYGRPVGPVYDTDHPNYGFINSVIRNGGSCTGVQSDYNPYPSYRSRPADYGPRYYDYQPRYRKPPASDAPRNRRDGYANPHPNTPNIPRAWGAARSQTRLGARGTNIRAPAKRASGS